MTDRITEHYQENPEGARLGSDEDIRGGQNRQAPGKKSAGSAAGKPFRGGKAQVVRNGERQEIAHPLKTPRYQ